ncbi:MAG: TRM11 family SAM-dependent methyltransferase [Candidatus Thorarchaeota archaeon]
MTDLIFVLGKNWLLSIAELIVHFQDRGHEVSVLDHSRTAALVRTKDSLSDQQIVDVQSHLGGCFKIGRLVWTYERSTIRDAFPNKGAICKDTRTEIKKCPWLPKVWKGVRGRKIKFGVSSYPATKGKSNIDIRRFSRSMNEYVKQSLIDQGVKRTDYIIYDSPDKRDPRRLNTALWPKSIAKHNLLAPPNAEILAMFGERKVYLAKTVVVYDSMLQQYRDESRPYTSSAISTSPKVCRTLLTFAGAKPGDTVLDPFCGSGTLLMEAAMLGMKCIGIDIEGDAVQGARSNLKWFGRDSGSWVDFRVIKGDAVEVAEIIQETVDAVAFEPTLGPVSTKKPSKGDAQKTITNLLELYREVLRGIAKVLRPNGKIAMTIPVIMSKDGEVSINIKEMLRGTGLVPYPLLPKEVIRSSAPKDSQLIIRTERIMLPERKQGQIIQRAVIMIGKP